MPEKWKKSADKGKEPGALLSELSIVFDCLSPELIIAKLNLCESDLPALYFFHLKQTNKVNPKYSSWEEMCFGVAQGCVLALILFNIFLRDIYLAISDTGLSSSIDDNTRSNPGNSLHNVIIKD